MLYIEALTSLLKSFDYDVDGAVVVDDDKKPVMVPITVSGKKINKSLVLPTTDMLKENDWTERVAFHPACENVVAGQSDIIKFLIGLVKSKMIEKSFLIVGELLKLEASTTKKKSTYAKYLSKFPDVSAKTIAGYNTFVKGIGEKGTVNDILKIYIDRKDYVDGTQYQRVLYLSSPLFEDNTDDAILMGVKLPTKASKVALRSILTDILFGGEVVRGSNAEIPYFDSIIRLWLDFSKKYNSIVKMITKDVALKEIDIEYSEVLDTFHDYRKRVPVLEGNSGESLLNKPKDDEDDEPPFDVDDEIEKQTRRDVEPDRRERSTRRRWREEEEEPKATGLNFFKPNGGPSTSRRGRDDDYNPSPLDRRLYTEERDRRSLRGRDRDRGSRSLRRR